MRIHVSFSALVFAAAIAPAFAQEAQDTAAPEPTVRHAPHTFGIVKSRTTWHIELVDGRTVDLSKSTEISPTGETIRPGDRLGLFGYYERPMTFLATSVTVIHDYGSAGIERVKGQ
jgi:hypothetical protein